MYKKYASALFGLVTMFCMSFSALAQPDIDMSVVLITAKAPADTVTYDRRIEKSDTVKSVMVAQPVFGVKHSWRTSNSTSALNNLSEHLSTPSSVIAATAIPFEVGWQTA